MNKFLIVSAVFIAGALLLCNLEVPASSLNTHQQYREYLSKFNKPEPTEVEFMYRASIFEKFLIQMEKHNSDNSQSWKMGVNQFSDLTQEEFMNTYLGEKNSATPQLKEEEINAGFAG